MRSEIDRMIIDYSISVVDHFTLNEARCHGDEGGVYHDCGLVILRPELLRPAAWVRWQFGKPIIVNSWNRCKSHNAYVGGKEDSYHLNGGAWDINAGRGVSMEYLEVLCRRAFPFVLPYDTFLHCDVRGERP